MTLRQKYKEVLILISIKDQILQTDQENVINQLTACVSETIRQSIWSLEQTQKLTE